MEYPHYNTPACQNVHPLGEAIIFFLPPSGQTMTFPVYSFTYWRRTQVAKGVDCKSIIQRFESARRLTDEGGGWLIYLSSPFELGFGDGRGEPLLLIYIIT